MSYSIELRQEGFEKHNCDSRRDGDLLIFECPQCGYHRVWNLETNKMHLIDAGDENVLHNGWHEPTGLQSDKYNPN